MRDVLAAGARDMFASKQDRSRRRVRNTFWALKDASFDVARGENVGIVGLNGAGKSTLLKLLSRITAPTVGSARVEGRLGALLEVGAGFHAELTGRENVFLYGSILGMRRKEVAAKFDAIVEFAEIAEFIDTPVKRYSSGMYVRLAFAVAAHLDPDILLLDEVLAVGDFAFQRKCMNFAKQLERKGATILFVSHNMSSIRSMCERVIYLKDGQIAFDGPTAEGLLLYETDSKLQNLFWFTGPSEETPIKVTAVGICNEAGDETSVFEFGQRARMRIAYHTSRPVERPDFRFGLTRTDETHCSTFSTAADGLDIPVVEGAGEIELLTPSLSLVADTYALRLVIRERGGEIVAAQDGGRFQIRHREFTAAGFGVFHESAEWRMPPSQAPVSAGRTAESG